MAYLIAGKLDFRLPTWNSEEPFGVSGETEYSRFKNERESSQEEENSELRYYDILGLSIDADPPEIKITYRRLVMQYHPDHVQHLGSEFQALAEEKIKEINMAYEYLQKNTICEQGDGVGLIV